MVLTAITVGAAAGRTCAPGSPPARRTGDAGACADGRSTCGYAAGWAAGPGAARPVRLGRLPRRRRPGRPPRRPGRPAAASATCAGWSGPTSRGELDPLVRDGAALLRAVLAGGVPAADAAPGADPWPGIRSRAATPARRGAGRRQRAASSRCRTAGNWDYAGAWVCATGWPLTHGRRAAQAGGPYRAVRRLPGVARHGDPAAHRRRPAADGRAHRAAAAEPRGRAPARPTGTCPRAGSRSSSSAGRPGCRPARRCSPLRTGAPLFVVTLWYDGDTPRGTGARPGAAAAGRRALDAAGRGADPGDRRPASPAGIAEHPADWHMLQRLWLDDLPRRRGAPDRAERRPPTGPAGARAAAGMRIGIVCPYSFDVPGGVQAHVQRPRRGADRARAPGQRARPGRRRRAAPPTWCRPGGRFRCATTAPSPGCRSGPVSAARVRRWLTGRRLRRDARPRAAHAQPVDAGRASARASRSWRPSTPRSTRSRALQAASGVLQLVLERITGPDRGQRTGPQGAGRAPRRRTPGRSPTASRSARYAGADAAAGLAREGGAIGFLGRFTSRARASRSCWRRSPGWPRRRPGLRLLVAGRGDPARCCGDMPPALARPGHLPRPGLRGRTRPGCCAASTSTSRPTRAASRSA